MKEVIKLAIVLLGYLGLAPWFGWVLSRHRRAERATFCLLVSMASWFPSKLTLMVDSVEFYRGHTKGFEFSLPVATGIALTVCGIFRRPDGFRLLPPGFFVYLFYCVLSGLSLLVAANGLYGMMAAWKFTSAVMILVGAYHGFRDAEDLRWLIRTLAVILMVQAGVCLKLRFADGLWQVHGWFEHQNPMAMWAYLCAVPLLAVAFAPEVSRRDTWLSLAGIAAAALMILLSVSRAALAAFIVGTAGVTVLACLRGLSAKKMGIISIGACGALAAGLLALDSVMARVKEDKGRDHESDLRLVLNLQSRAMLHDSALGVGWNNFGVANSLPNDRCVTILMDSDASRGFRIIEDNYFACPLTESLYWLLLSETGYPGFIGFLLFLALTLWWGVRGLVYYWKTPLGYFIGGVLIALMLTYVHGTVERVLSQTKNLTAWLVFAGVTARVEYARQQARRPRARSTTAPIEPGFAMTLAA